VEPDVKKAQYDDVLSDEAENDSQLLAEIEYVDAELEVDKDSAQKYASADDVVLL
jgi:hypothetical protein